MCDIVAKMPSDMYVEKPTIQTSDQLKFRNFGTGRSFSGELHVPHGPAAATGTHSAIITSPAVIDTTKWDIMASATDG